VYTPSRARTCRCTLSRSAPSVFLKQSEKTRALSRGDLSGDLGLVESARAFDHQAGNRVLASRQRGTARKPGNCQRGERDQPGDGPTVSLGSADSTGITAQAPGRRLAN
jgi:hypothetical protein